MKRNMEDELSIMLTQAVMAGELALGKCSRPVIRKLLQRLRDPDAEMGEAMIAIGKDCGSGTAPIILGWRAAIDVALQPQPPIARIS